ncbi:hypothetical protein QB910_000113 [Dabrowskivirus KKP3916]|uniref:Integrase n=1 Tax=Alicyclobacillus phage KKP_3916 TaxID=3040651 RepID=A0AAT9V8T7_9CAUD|nr:hypothetical protein QB910_000113 [Alicyclobacillus phage KKP 3916]
MSSVTWYNKEVKESFLASYPEGTANSYKRIFDHSYEKECEYGRDLADFTIPQIRELLSDLEPRTTESARTSGSIISAYLNWAVEKGIRKESSSNPLLTVSKDWFDEFVTIEPHKLYLTNKDLRVIEARLNNAQDLVVVRLLWEGCSGSKLSEITNLKKSDVKWDEKKLVLTDEKGNKRDLHVSDECLEYIDDAIKQKLYRKKNDQANLPKNLLPYNKLVQNEYVVRSSLTHTVRENEPVDKYVIYRRIELIRDLIGYDYLSVKNVQRSGMIYYAKCLMEQNNMSRITNDLLSLVAERFKVNNIYRMKEYINEDIIRQMYPDFGL